MYLMKRYMIHILLIALSALLISCQTVTVIPKNNAYKISSSPTYQRSLPFFIGGLVGEKHVDAKIVCANRPVAQFQTENTFLDQLLLIVTLGIYAPRTVKIWCG